MVLRCCRLGGHSCHLCSQLRNTVENAYRAVVARVTPLLTTARNFLWSCYASTINAEKAVR
jgi:hypothetical protein